VQDPTVVFLYNPDLIRAVTYDIDGYHIVFLWVAPNDGTRAAPRRLSITELAILCPRQTEFQPNESYTMQGARVNAQRRFSP
jgi:hypothetical protein